MKRKGQIKFSTTPRAISARSTSGGLSKPGTATSLEGVGLFISAVGCPSDLCAANQFVSDRRQQESRIRHYLAGSNGTGSPVSDVGCSSCTCMDPADNSRCRNVLLSSSYCCSVFIGQQQCRDRSVSLSNDPQCLSLAHAIAAQQSEALFETQFVFSLVVLAEIAPIAAKMARKELQWRPVRLF